MRKQRTAAILALGLLGAALVAPRPLPAQTLPAPLNNASATLGADHTSGSDTLVLATGAGAMFGTPTVDSPIRVTVARRSTLVNGQIGANSTRTVYQVTGRSGDTLSGLSVPGDESTGNWTNAEASYSRNDVVASLITAGAIKSIHTSLAAKVGKTGDETVAGTKTFSSPIAGSVTGNAGTVTNGAYLNAANVFTQTQTLPLRDKGGQWFNVKAYGAVGDGVADDSAAIDSAVAAADAAGGGTVFFPPGTYLRTTQLNLPHDAASPPGQNPIRLLGSGTTRSLTKTSGALGGATLDLRYTGGGTGAAKITTVGGGVLTIEHMDLIDGGTSSNPFLLTTNTVLRLRNIAVVGNTTKSGQTCDQDGVILGGMTNVTGGSGTNDAFQGYGTVLDTVFFNRIRRGVYARVYSNASVITNCIWGTLCGGTATEGAVEIVGISGSGAGGVVVGPGNLIEMGGYVYGIRLSPYSEHAIICNNTMWDAGTGLSPSHIYIDSNSTAHRIRDNYQGAGVPLVSGPGVSGGKHIIEEHTGTKVGWLLNNIGISDQTELQTTTCAQYGDVVLYRTSSGAYHLKGIGAFIGTDQYLGDFGTGAYVDVGSGGTANGRITAGHSVNTSAGLILSPYGPLGSQYIQLNGPTRANNAWVVQNGEITLSVAGTVTLDATASSDWRVTLQANCSGGTFSNPMGLGHRLTVTFIQDATGGRTYAWPSTCKFAGNSAPSDTTASTQTTVTFIWNGSRWCEISRAVAVPTS